MAPLYFACDAGPTGCTGLETLCAVIERLGDAGAERRIMLHQSAPEGIFQRLFAPERGEGGRIVADISAQVLSPTSMAPRHARTASMYSAGVYHSFSPVKRVRWWRASTARRTSALIGARPSSRAATHPPASRLYANSCVF